MERVVIVLVELRLVEQRYAAVLEVINESSSVTDVAFRYGVTRQTVHRWPRRYATDGLAGLADGSAKPLSCPHQMPAEIEARIVELRRLQPGWGPRTIRFRLEAEQVEPLPSRSAIYRCLVRHQLIVPEARRRKKADYRRWERSRPMELWQMDVVGGVRLVNGWKASIVSGIDDHSRFIISAHVVERATARPVCEALTNAMRSHGLPQEILTDNGKVFTGRFGPGKGEVLFDRICRENGIKHILTRPRSPTTTGKIERWHKTLRREFLNGKVFESIADAQAKLDGWVTEYNHDRRHQGIGDVVPWERFRLAGSEPVVPVEPTEEPSTTRKVGRTGKISFAAVLYPVGVWLDGETVDVSVADGLVSIHHQGVLIATHAQRHRPAKEKPALKRRAKKSRPRPKQPTVGQSVTRKVDSSGSVSFAGHGYRISRKHCRRQVQVAIVGDTVEISAGGELLKVHPIRHDRSRENGAFANAGGRPSRTNAA
ncbi:MAG: IS481 family transposase [Ilumatobacter sp.]|uniref:IS481 family transposase n=1 Tax=Ilumatobacter sp. TaxID=1967498 RepID=UPI003C79005E